MNRKSKPVEVGVISKVLKVFEVIQTSPLPLPLNDICKLTGLNRSTAYRFVAHLEREAYLFRDEDGNYSFGTKLLQMNAPGNDRSRIREMARPSLIQLWRETQETVNLAVLDDGKVLYVDVIQSPHLFRLATKIGIRRPFYATSLGKAMAAFLRDDERRRLLSSESFEALTPNTISSVEELESDLRMIYGRGYAIDDEESFLGARCVAAPVINHNHEPIAAISVAGPTQRLTRDKLASIANAVKAATRSISDRMGFSDGQGS